MASSEVDQKFLGRLAKAVEPDNPLLASMLFKILGLSIGLSQELVTARKQRRLISTGAAPPLNLYFHILWLAREGSVMLEQYVIPMVGNYTELKVLAFKLRASFHHIFVLFHNNPPIANFGYSTPEIATSVADSAVDVKGKGLVETGDYNSQSAFQAGRSYDGGPVGPPPGLGPEQMASFLLPSVNYLPMTQYYFQEALAMADKFLWGSHSLRLSVRTEYSSFLYECVGDADASRKMAKDTIAEVYEATEGIDNDMFNDACELVTVLGKMMKRGLNNPGNTNKPAQAKPAVSIPPTAQREERLETPPAMHREGRLQTPPAPQREVRVETPPRTTADAARAAAAVTAATQASSGFI